MGRIPPGSVGRQLQAESALAAAGPQAGGSVRGGERLDSPFFEFGVKKAEGGFMNSEVFPQLVWHRPSGAEPVALNFGRAKAGSSL